MTSFAHLHAHSDFSVLDGTARVEDLVARAAEFGHVGIALTDHGVMSGAVSLMRACGTHGIRAIPGLEAYLVDPSIPGDKRYHLTLLSRNEAGYRNLVRLSSEGWLSGLKPGGFGRKYPCVDHEMLARFSEGVVCLSGCMSGIVSRHLAAGNDTAAAAELDRLRSIYGAENLRVEIQNNGVSEQIALMEPLARLAQKMGLTCVATSDVHYLRQDDSVAHDCWLCIQTQSVLSDPKRFSFSTDRFHLRSTKEMLEAFSSHPEWVHAAGELASECGVHLPAPAVHLPQFPVPDDRTPEEYLTALCERGLYKRYDDAPSEKAKARLADELASIISQGLSSYFLIVWDYVRFARREGVPVGPGRGSAAGSLVSYCLAITDLCPLEHGLLFERFLAPGRKGLPDIDVDFGVQGRERVLSYVSERYGHRNVARIGTVGRLLARSALRDAARALEVPYSQADRLAKLVPDGAGMTLDHAIAQSPELAAAASGDSWESKVIAVAKPLAGLARSEGTHAAGVVIAPDEVTEFVPVRVDDEGQVVTQFDMDTVESLGLVKADFLGLRNLDVIDDALAMVATQTGDDPIAARDIPLTDPATYALLAEGRTMGVFQVESALMRDILTQVVPSEFSDLVAVVSLGRPGAMRYVPDYARGKRDPMSVVYEDPKLAEVLAETYGQIVYQEQMMQASRILAGFTPEQADRLRKGIGKKIRDVVDSLRDEFVQGCRDAGTKSTVAERVWRQFEEAASYSFNKSHAACYALISYQTAWIKAHHAAPFWAALLSSVVGTKDRVGLYVRAAEREGMTIVGPCVNRSEEGFSVLTDETVRMGLSAVKGLGDGAVAAIVEARTSGRFVSLEDLIVRCGEKTLSRRGLEALIGAGALDEVSDDRGALFAQLTVALTRAKRDAEVAASGQLGLFEAPAAAVEIFAPPFSEEERADWEAKTLGLWLTSDPLSAYEADLLGYAQQETGDLAETPDGDTVFMGAVCRSVTRTPTRRGDDMARLVLADRAGEVEAVAFGEVADAAFGLRAGDVVAFSARCEQKSGGGVSLMLNHLMPLSGASAREDVSEAELVA